MTQNPKSKPKPNRMKTLRTFRPGGGVICAPCAEPSKSEELGTLELSTKPNRNHCNRSNRIEFRNTAFPNNP